MNLNGPATLVAQNTFARRVLLDADGLWKIKDQYNAGPKFGPDLGAAALDTDGDGTKEVVLLDRRPSRCCSSQLKDGVYRPERHAVGRDDQLHRLARRRSRRRRRETTC